MDFGPTNTPISGETLRAALSAVAREADGRGHEQRAGAIRVLGEALAAARADARARLEAGEGGLATARALAAAADAVVSALFDFVSVHVFRARNPTEGERLSILAVGGYGRGALAPFSDLDLLFLRPYKPTAHVESVIEYMLYVLWDLGLKVGHASRTADECLRLAAGDSTIRTGLVDARLVAGDAKLAEDLSKRFRKSAQAREARTAFVAAKLEERDRRHARAGASRYLVEPNIKEGKGGLRDLDTLYWIADFLHGKRAVQGLDRLGPFDHRDVAALQRAMDFLWAARCHLHFAAGRPEERLTFDLQPEVARRMGYADRGPHAGVERFMRRYFSTAREVGALTRTFCAELEAAQTKARPTGLSRLWPGAGKKRKALDEPGFHEDGGRLAVDGIKVFRRDPVNLLRLFQLADRLDLDLHPSAVASVRRALPMMTPRLRRDPEAVRLFLDVLARGRNTYRTLSLMTETGLLGRFVTEFNHTVGQMQFNMYHAYTVDEHTLRAVGVIADIAAGRLEDEHPLTAATYRLITDKEALYLAMLLHDTGKGGGEDQETAGEKAARTACRRMGLSPERVDLVAWLVGHHLLMSDVAQKRDIQDPRTVENFVRAVETPERLRLLLVLTVADIRAVGPGVWNGWKGELLRELYTVSTGVFRGAVDLEAEASGRHEPVAAAAIEREGVEVRLDGRRNTAEIIVTTPDRNGLFADLVETLAAHGAQVVAAKVRTTAGQARDAFFVQDASGAPFGKDSPRRLKSLKAALAQAAQGRPQRAPAAPPPSTVRRAYAFAIGPAVAWDNEASADSTVIETSGRDRPGLLAALARAISAAGLSIQSAHIDNYGERAVDAFYIRDAHGAKLTKEAATALKSVLLKVLAEGEAPEAELPRARASERR